MRWPATALIVATLATALAAEPALFRVKWKFRAAGAILSTPAVRDGRVYCATSDSGLLHALS